MKKIWFILIFMVVCTSCTSKESEKKLDSINPGLYEIKFAVSPGDQSGYLKMNVRYSPSGTYKGSIFFNESRIQEFKGRFKVEKGKLKAYDKLIRTPDPKNHGWSPWQSEEPSEVAVRNIKKTSYEYYCVFTKDKEKFTALGLTEGWKTYTRISD